MSIKMLIDRQQIWQKIENEYMEEIWRSRTISTYSWMAHGRRSVCSLAYFIIILGFILLSLMV